MFEISSSFPIISVHLSLPLFNLTQWKDTCASYSFTTKKLTNNMCQVSLVVKYRTMCSLYNFIVPSIARCDSQNFLLQCNFRLEQFVRLHQLIKLL